MVVLLGSYGRAWQEKAAKELEGRVGCIICGSWPDGVSVATYLAWLVPLVEEANHILFWVNGPPWSEWEFGYVLGLIRGRRRGLFPVFGVDPAWESARPAIAGALDSIGAQVPIHDQLAIATSAVEAELRCIR